MRPVTDAPPHPAAVMLLQIIEDLCAAIAQATGLGLFGRLLLIPVRRRLRGMAQMVSEAIADAAAVAPDAAPILVSVAPSAPQDPGVDALRDLASNLCPNPPRTEAAPIEPPCRDGEALSHRDRPHVEAAAPAARSGDDGDGDDGALDPRVAPGDATAPVLPHAGRRTIPVVGPARLETGPRPRRRLWRLPSRYGAWAYRAAQRPPPGRKIAWRGRDFARPIRYDITII